MDPVTSGKVICHQIARRIQWMRWRREFACEKAESGTHFPVQLFSHSSKLIRAPERADQDLQFGKINNLTIAAAALDRVVVAPGKTLSFWYLVGKPTAPKGYQPGLELYKGRLVSSVGGGLCQLSNLLYWMALHLCLETVERHRHSFDLFPDKARKVPFGAGASVFYNYRDLHIRNSLPQPILLRVGVGEEELWGEFRGQAQLSFQTELYERGHRFFELDGKVFRENHLWRRTVDREGNVLEDKELLHNLCEVLYPIEF